MAIAIDTSGTIGTINNPVTSITYAFNNSAGNFLSVGVLTTASQTISGVTYNSVALTKIGGIPTWGNQPLKIELWGLSSPATGSNNIVVSASSGPIYSTAMSHSGTATTGQPDSFNTGFNASNVASLAVSTTVVSSNCWLIGLACGDNGNNPSAGSGTTLRSTIATDAYIALFDSNGTVGTGSQTLNFAFSPNQHPGAIVASIKPPGSSSSIKTINGLALASVKTLNGLAIASVKTLNGLA